jgi:hypothetical protein
LVLGDAGFFTALGVAAPDLGQIEADVDGSRLLAAGEAGADSDQAVFNLAKPPVVHSGHPDGAIALFPKSAVVYDEPAARGSAKQSAGPAGDLIH